MFLPGGPFVKLDESENSEWETIRKTFREFSEWFPESLIVIGGVAVYLRSVDKIGQSFLEYSHDGDFYLSLVAYSELRDIEVVTGNPRLKKHQLIKNGVDFDIYVERNNNLVVPFEEAFRYATIIDGFRVACSEHLLALKLEAFKDRQGTPKGEKDERDLIRIVLTVDNFVQDVIRIYLDEENRKILRDIGRHPEPFLVMASNNAHNASMLREQYHTALARIEKNV